LISINKPAVNANQTVATTGAVDKYVVKSFIKRIRILIKEGFSKLVGFYKLVKTKNQKPTSLEKPRIVY
jgi:hypothetical protein